MKAPFKTVVLLVAALLLAPALARADVLKIVVRDTIQPISDEFIGRALEQAARDHDEAVIIELSTPGGLLDSTRSIIEKILASPVPVIVYVAPSSARAASAGFFILESADIAAMAPGTNTGAAHPVVFGGEKMDDVMKAKMENDAAAFMRSFVSKRGRNVELAESAVRQSKSFTDQEALKENLIDVIAPDVPDLLKQLDGRSVTRFNGSTTVLHLANQRVQTLEMSLKQRILDFIMDPNVAFVLFAIGMLALYVEFNHPGAIVPGVVGFIFVLLAIFAFNILPTRHAALILIVAAFVMFILDAKFATHGVLTVGGIALMILGALLLVDAPIPEMRVRLVTALAVSVPIGLITVFLVGLVIKARRSKVVTGSQGLIGEIGVAQSALQPEGKVFVHGELWDAVSSANVAPGARVLVKRIDGLRLSVEPVK
ncbi:MAG TPA: nodulation protein NfeD [Terriglobales bacterium]|nr:nodulation protein NfeD [Terriglobales bacterium]